MLDDSKQTSSRIVSLDLLRGYFLLSMTVNHLNYWPNGLDWLTARGQLFVSSAEGFFLISGIVLGIIRGRKLIDRPIWMPVKLLFKRSAQLYLVYIISILFFTFIGWWFFMDNPGLKYGIASPQTNIWALLVNTLTFQYIYTWADYLRLYVLFIMLSPLAIYFLRHGKWLILMGMSIAIWALVPRPSYPDSLVLQPYHWQLLFFGGLTIGYHWNSLRNFWFKLRLRTRKIIILSTVSSTILVILANLVLVFGGYFGEAAYSTIAPLGDLLKVPFDKENLTIYRIMYTVICFVTGLWLVSRFKSFFEKYFGWILLPFGTNSLYVYIVQAFLVFFAHLILPSGSHDLIMNILITFSVLLVLYLMVRFKVLFKIIPR